MGKDVAKVLGYAKSRNALAVHVDKEDKMVKVVKVKMVKIVNSQEN